MTVLFLTLLWFENIPGAWGLAPKSDMRLRAGPLIRYALEGWPPLKNVLRGWPQRDPSKQG